MKHFSFLFNLESESGLCANVFPVAMTNTWGNQLIKSPILDSGFTGFSLSCLDPIAIELLTQHITVEAHGKNIDLMTEGGGISRRGWGFYFPFNDTPSMSRGRSSKKFYHPPCKKTLTQTLRIYMPKLWHVT